MPLKINLKKRNQETNFVTVANFDKRMNKTKRVKIHLNRYVRKIMQIKLYEKLTAIIEKARIIKKDPKEFLCEIKSIC